MTLEVIATLIMKTAVVWVVTLRHTVWKVCPEFEWNTLPALSV